MRDPADRGTPDMLGAIYRVDVRKASGEWREFSRYRSPTEASTVARRLASLGASVRADVLPAEEPTR